MGEKDEDPSGRVTTHITSFMHCGAMQTVGTILWEKNTCRSLVSVVSTAKYNKQKGIYRWRLLRVILNRMRRPRRKRLQEPRR